MDHCIRDEWLSITLQHQTARELLNALDLARQPDHCLGQQVTEEQRLLRHHHIDVARQVIQHLEKQIGRSDALYELVSRAGMRETAEGQWASRLAIELEH